MTKEGKKGEEETRDIVTVLLAKFLILAIFRLLQRNKLYLDLKAQKDQRPENQGTVEA